MFYTYSLESKRKPDERYIGSTSDLKRRLRQHNSDETGHTAKYRPWKLMLYVALETRQLAENFERYLKSGSGHAFAKRHFRSEPEAR